MNILFIDWIATGNDGDEYKDVQELYNACGDALDRACSWDIMGQVLFEGEDGVVYTLCVEGVISEANLEYVKEVKEEQNAL